MKLTVLGALSALAASSLAFTVPAQCTLDCVLLSAFNEKCNDAKTNGCFDFCKNGDNSTSFVACAECIAVAEGANQDVVSSITSAVDAACRIAQNTYTAVKGGGRKAGYVGAGAVAAAAGLVIALV